MRRVVLGTMVTVMLVTTGFSADRAKRPRLDLRATPRVAFSPVDVLVTAELMGGDDVEEFHCPALLWDWDDGAKSTQESDCEPLEAGGNVERRFTAHHAYRQAGTYNVKIRMARADRTVALASTTVTVRPGLADMSENSEN